MSDDQDRAAARRLVDEFGGDYRRWLTDQFGAGGGAPFTALFSVLILAASGSWFLASENPSAHAELLDWLGRTFTLGAADWAAGRYHCHVSHALL